MNAGLFTSSWFDSVLFLAISQLGLSIPLSSFARPPTPGGVLSGVSSPAMHVATLFARKDAGHKEAFSGIVCGSCKSHRCRSCSPLQLEIPRLFCAQREAWICWRFVTHKVTGWYVFVVEEACVQFGREIGNCQAGDVAPARFYKEDKTCFRTYV
eukprot:1165387-Amphidinium_carterae.2